MAGRMYKILPVFWWLGACTWREDAHTGATGWDSGWGCYCTGTEFNSASSGCDEEGLWVDAVFVGWISHVALFMADTSTGYYEPGHVFPPTESYAEAPSEDTRGYYDPRGMWENPYLTLRRVAAPADVVYGESTAFTCEASAQTLAIEVTDISGSYIGCFAWGAAPRTQDPYPFSQCASI